MGRIAASFAIFVFAISASLTAQANWTLSEVSVLIPLPHRQEFNQMIKPDDSGVQGALFPRNVYGELPRLLIGGNPDLIYKEQLRVVGLRIDPCFQEGPAPLSCRRQLRLIWQPLEFGKNANKASALDAAAHSFYDFDEETWTAFLLEWRAAVHAPESVSLDVHPTLAREGLTGPAWSKLKSVVLKYAGEKTLTRVTSMNVDPLGSLWAFTGVDLNQGQIKRIAIPRVDRLAQGFFIDPTRLVEFRASLNPYPEDQIGWLNVLNDSESMKDQDQIRDALQQAARIENPRLENTGGIDCVSCHVAQTVRMWGERRGFANTYQTELADLIYPARAASADARTGFVNRLRAFGYFLDETNISRRTLNESIEVMERLNRTPDQNF